MRASAAQLMDPSTRPRDAAAIARRDPAILWIAGNVHGGEESGTDASLRVLWELADRSDCAAKQILDEALVVLLPTQNPDGRELDTRRNAYGFDMNRDWFARTQPETDGKLEMLRRYPPRAVHRRARDGRQRQLLLPAQRGPDLPRDDRPGGVAGSTTSTARPTSAVRRARDPVLQLRDVYDLFYQGYGDTVPATGFGAAGMTYEKSSGDAASQRVLQQYLTQWNSLSQAALNKQEILTGWHDGWVEAERQGRAGELEPNEVVQPENEVQQPVPDIKVRHYFLRADDPAKARETQALVRRLQRMDVRVRRLTKPLPVGDYTPYGRPARDEVLPAGTYVVEMDQAKKHWVQAMLNEDTYVPFPYFYDVTAWSQPLLFNVAGGYSGRRLADLRSAPVAAQADPGVPDAPADAPRIALYSMSPQFTRGIESAGWLHYLLDRWGLEYTDVSAEDIKAGALDDADVLVVPDGYATIDPDFPEDPYGLGDLGPEGQAAIRTWVEDGGRYVGWLDGAVLASGVGVSSATFEERRGERDLLAGRADPHDRRAAEPAGRRGRALRVRVLRLALRDAGERRRGAGPVPVGLHPRLLRLGLRRRRGGAERQRGGRRRARRRRARRWRSASSRTSARSPTGPRGSSATRSSARRPRRSRTRRAQPARSRPAPPRRRWRRRTTRSASS